MRDLRALVLSLALAPVALPGQVSSSSSGGPLPQVADSLTFKDVDGTEFDLTATPIVHGRDSGVIRMSFTNPTTQTNNLKIVYGYYKNGAVYDIPHADNFFSQPAVPVGTVITTSIPYFIDSAVGSGSHLPSYGFTDSGTFLLKVWLGTTSGLALNHNAEPSGSILAVRQQSFEVVYPEVEITVPSRNSPTPVIQRTIRVTLQNAVSFTRYVWIAGSGGFSQVSFGGSIPANSTYVEYPVVNTGPTGRLHAYLTPADGSSLGGIGYPTQGFEMYVSPEVEPVFVNSDGTVSMNGSVSAGGDPVESPIGTWPVTGEYSETVGVHAGNTECKHEGGAAMDSTGMPNVALCSSCNFTSDLSGDSRRACQGKIPGSTGPIISEAVCGDATTWGGYQQAQPTSYPNRHCVVTETNEEVHEYKLDSSGTIECTFIGISFSWFFLGFEGMAKYCCFYSNTDSDTTIPVRRCTTVEN